jgi:hypothetical protein
LLQCQVANQVGLVQVIHLLRLFYLLNFWSQNSISFH